MNLDRLTKPLKLRLGRLNSRDRRALLLGAWLLGPALAYIWIVKPATADFVDAKERLLSERDLLLRERALLATAPDLPVSMARADSAVAQAQTRLFPGSDPVSATATLARHVTERAARHRVLVQGSEARNPEALDQELLRLVVEVRAIGDLAGITAWLADLEEGARLVDITDLRITPAGRVGEDVEDEEVLGVLVRATGLALAREVDTGAVALGATR